MFTVTDTIKKKLASDENSSSIKYDVDIIEKGMNRIKTIVKQLIDLHSIDHKLKGIDHLDKIVERVVSFIRPIAKERNVRISMRCNLHNVKIFVSESQFFHVLLNLCLSLFDTNNEIIEVATKKQNNFAAIEIRARKRVSTKIDGRPALYSIHTDTIDLAIPKSIIQHYNGTIEIHENKSGQTINIKLPTMNETGKNRKINI
jgi:C4-dicarboxylate-specific signal transduction histidine kinase